MTTNAEGSSEKEMDIVRQSMDYNLNELKETWVGILQNTVDRGDLNGILNFFTKISEAVGNLTDKFGLLEIALTGLMTVGMRRSGLD